MCDLYIGTVTGTNAHASLNHTNSDSDSAAILRDNDLEDTILSLLCFDPLSVYLLFGLSVHNTHNKIALCLLHKEKMIGRVNYSLLLAIFIAYHCVL